MKPFVVTVVAVILGIGMVSGCTPSNPPSSNQQSIAKTDSAHAGNARSALHAWRTVWKPFLVQGKIVGITKQSPESLKLQIDHIVSYEWGPNSPKFPYNVGSTVTIRFDGPFPGQGPMHPKIGEEIELNVAQYSAGSNSEPYWGSNLSNYFYQKDGQFYDAKGYVVAMPTA